MISFESTEDENAFVSIAQKIASENIRPYARESENKGMIRNDMIKVVNELGFLKLEEPESYGGLQLPLISQVQIQAALSYGDLGIVQGLPGLADGASLLRSMEPKQMNKDQQKLVCEGESTIAFIDDINDKAMGKRLSLTKNGTNYTLHGTSQPTRLGQMANHLILAVLDEEGYPVICWMDKKHHHWKVNKGDYRFGLLAASIAKISFNNEIISQDQVIATGEKADQLIRRTHTRIQIIQAAKQVGLMQAALDYATEYTAMRKAFDQVIAKFQGVSFQIARMVIETRIANHLVWEAATVADKNTEEAEGPALRAIQRAHQGVRYVTNSAVQLLGGHGYVKDYPVEKWMRDAQAQVMLYGREKNYLIRRGKQILATKEKAVIT
ncbi:acyl-CoA dehydrogenase family protein [Pseudogracilibacillus auburnensis]|uniref:acyl-CoA dehydrogenase family protein n=1 Tax=Pseudogracilibacillus auburnensis TaxID=1494959 RepID=UPI001A96C2F5|nr:acyl-CoA dehydrogenase family protein [Pseudogracilibacillus auburnensis]MBO1002582.1 acyl-CoA dehydrogenase family protein [Pseudogracilibacillus auburnensis]